MTSYLLLFLAAFGAATILPFPSEVSFAYVVSRAADPLPPVLVATAGNYLGACTTYLLARTAAAQLARRRGPADPRWTRAAVTVRRFGAPALLLSWVPILGDGLVAVAGASRMPFGRFSVFTAAGKGARYAVLAWVLSR